ncbi:peroxidase family protein [Sorangium sp. So ce117]|uniref:peroxidase family protein n=1 Tax=Sorangium sp. So ce117 TaxID=3133277 RepID=UPI003F5F4D5F
MKRRLMTRAFEGAFSLLNRLVPWHRLPPSLGTLNLLAYRNKLRRENLHDTNDAPQGKSERTAAPPRPEALIQRTPDGSYNDLDKPAMGCTGTRFGRNVPLKYTYPEPEDKIMEPSPRIVSSRLLARREFVPATSLNLLAAAWIQLMTRDWFNHGTPVKGDELRVPLDKERGDDWYEDPMLIRRTPPDNTRLPDTADRPPTYLNHSSHWWDASMFYGSSEEELAKLIDDRDGAEGKLKLDLVEGHLIGSIPAQMRKLAEVSNQWWIGLSLIHTLFVKEHNAIVDHLRRHYPEWSAARLFHTARLVNVALIAKIHTVEWTTAILGHPTLDIAMNANWWGFAGERLTRALGRGRPVGPRRGSEVLNGIIGSQKVHHTAPYAMTEEFVSVYRMHPLMPDAIQLFRAGTGGLERSVALPDVSGQQTVSAFNGDLSMTDLLYSFGIAHPGAVVLHNYPAFLRNLQRDDQSRIDLAAIDVMRDRERGVPRYNQFRRLLHLDPVKSFEEITSNKEWARELREVYGDVERVDLMVGMFAEDFPAGFGFSDTAFRVFILMASRRLKSDRFFTTDYNESVYSREGLDWIDNNTMSSVLLRHNPDLAPMLRQVENAFAPWARVDAPGAPGAGSK